VCSLDSKTQLVGTKLRSKKLITPATEILNKTVEPLFTASPHVARVDELSLAPPPAFDLLWVVRGCLLSFCLSLPPSPPSTFFLQRFSRESNASLGRFGTYRVWLQYIRLNPSWADDARVLSATGENINAPGLGKQESGNPLAYISAQDEREFAAEKRSCGTWNLEGMHSAHARSLQNKEITTHTPVQIQAYTRPHTRTHAHTQIDKQNAGSPVAHTCQLPYAVY